MGTIMLYHSETSTLAKPDIVDFTIRMSKKAQTAKDAVTELNVSRALATDYIKGLKSYRPESFKQENIDLRSAGQAAGLNLVTGRNLKGEDKKPRYVFAINYDITNLLALVCLYL